MTSFAKLYLFGIVFTTFTLKVNILVSHISIYRKDIRAALLKKDKDLASGYDDVVCEYLLKMPYLYHVVATTFTKIQDDIVAPDAWGVSKIIL